MTTAPVAARITTRFLLTCLLRGMTGNPRAKIIPTNVSTHMPLARHDPVDYTDSIVAIVSTHMPLARHDVEYWQGDSGTGVSTHMPLARHDERSTDTDGIHYRFLLTCLLRGMTILFKRSPHFGWFLLTCLLRGMTW